ncbi:hypothetical protein GCM10007205_09490 [Oxalicibacterium flavum]|uniref:GGDEF domain-containing protein n=1 Tax=Oxalicibacterium flavum TaxID=179467 RepID=A0A8J2XXN1_9BURK|nr:EAL domain-containing protein [Oxalicibacterium flavum]GGC02331.1 hypothetical protein GCM10007205_09490 [Oxalicibacterium flavum]
MKAKALRPLAVYAGSDIFRVGSLLLHATLLLHIAMQVVSHQVLLSHLGTGAIVAVAFTLLASFLRYFWLRTSFLLSQPFLLLELAAVTAAIVAFSLLKEFPVSPIPWLIAIAGVFPLVLRERIAAVVIIVLAFVGYQLNFHESATVGEWAPDLFATLSIGFLSLLLARTLHLNRVALEKIRTNERRFDAIVRVTRHVFIITDRQFHLKFANPALQEVIGYSFEELAEGNIRPAVHPDDLEEHREKMHHLRDTPHSEVFSRHRMQHRDGHWVWLETRGYNMLHDSAIAGMIFSIEDVTLRKNVELKLQEETALLRAVLDLNPSMIYAKDAEGRFTISNQRFQQRFGYRNEDELRGKTTYDLCLQTANQGDEMSALDIADEIREQDEQVMRTGQPLLDIEGRGFWRNEIDRWFHTSKYPLPDAGGRIIGVLGVTRDITKRKKYELQIEYQALHDILTELPNRRYLVNTLDAAMVASRQRQASLTLLFLDLDFFKSLNDTHGHDFGDKCLIEISKRIIASLPQKDFVARFGGNEFAILTNATLAEAAVKANKVMRAVSERLIIDDVSVKLQTSIGIAQLTEDHLTPADLIRDADAAMYQAKERGRNRAEIYDAAMQIKLTRHARMDVALRFALERNELSLVYQPKVSLTDGSVEGFEVLMRWDSPEYGSISPSDFIPIAEASGMMVPIGIWALEQACRQLATWQQRYPGIGKMSLAVNVSMRQLLQTTFFTQVREILDSSGVRPGTMELELTETSAMANPMQTMETLSLLKKLGLRLALDDFGTGYSSLAYLQRLPIDILKIDKAFVQGLGSNQSDMEIIRLMMALAKTLHLETVAEGVETMAQIEELQKMGCTLGQGYLFSPPLLTAEAEALIRSTHVFSLNSELPD